MEQTIRLSPQVITHIQHAFTQVFGHGEVYLFGSRADEQQHGGDIDLYLIPEDKQSIAMKKIDFLVALKRLIGEQKIDVIIDQGTDRLIDQLARQTGVLLWQKH
jgi:hypothetical protein